MKVPRAPAAPAAGLALALLFRAAQGQATSSCLQDGSSYAYNETVTGSARTIVTNHCPNHPFYNLNPNYAVEGWTTYTVPAMPTFVGNETNSTNATAYVDLSQTGGAIGVLFSAAQLFSPYAGPSVGQATNWFTSATHKEGNTFDQCGCHSSSTTQPSYHCHVPPSCLLNQLGQTDTAHSPQIGWAFDGFPVYGPRGPGGAMMRSCTTTGGTYGVDTCTDDCGGYYADDGSIDKFVYRYYTMGDYNDGKSCDLPGCPSPQWQYYPHTAACFRGCCPAGVACHSSITPCPGTAGMSGSATDFAVSEGYTGGYVAEVPTVNGLSVAAGLPQNLYACPCTSLWCSETICSSNGWLEKTCRYGETNDCPITLSSVFGAVDDRQDAQGAILVTILVSYACLSVFVAFACCGCARIWRVQRHKWHWLLGGTLGLMLFLLVMVPAILVLVCMVMGTILAAVEGWGVLLGFEYLMGNALGMQDPLTNVTPDSDSGKIVDLIISVWTMLLVTSAMGLSANMVVMHKTTASLPGTCTGLVSYMFVFVPLVLAVLAFATGGLIAAAEGWSYLDGVFFMAGALAGLSSPVINQAPATSFGAFLECVCLAIELSLAGGVIGVVSSHPTIEHLIRLIEGTPAAPRQRPGLTGAEGQHSDRPGHRASGRRVSGLAGGAPAEGGGEPPDASRSEDATAEKDEEEDEISDEGGLGRSEQDIKTTEELDELKKERDELLAALKVEREDVEAARRAVAQLREEARGEQEELRQKAREQVRKEIEEMRHAAKKDWEEAMHLWHVAREETDKERQEAKEERERAMQSLQDVSVALSGSPLGAFSGQSSENSRPPTSGMSRDKLYTMPR